MNKFTCYVFFKSETKNYNLQNHTTFQTEERLVNLVRRGDHFIGLSTYYFMMVYCTVALTRTSCRS